MKKIVSLFVLSAALLALTGSTVACSSQPAATTTPATTPATAPVATTPSESEVRAYADPETEETLKGLSDKNLAEYTKYGNQGFKDAVTQTTFDSVANQISTTYGTFESIEFLSVEEAQGYIVVHYRATYSKRQIGVRMVFDSDHLVAGQFFE